MSAFRLRHFGANRTASLQSCRILCTAPPQSCPGHQHLASSILEYPEQRQSHIAWEAETKFQVTASRRKRKSEDVSENDGDENHEGALLPPRASRKRVRFDASAEIDINPTRDYEHDGRASEQAQGDLRTSQARRDTSNGTRKARKKIVPKHHSCNIAIYAEDAQYRRSRKGCKFVQNIKKTEFVNTKPLSVDYADVHASVHMDFEAWKKARAESSPESFQLKKE
ncbi:hypothetical protein BDV96DRAFT_24991 [Lophiotrema nucula]|uniref:Uncharacterized protein n=1 Tax=Lophiotrema nucula TaxID=690887 RepID=A0A6A5ZD08_9PLEO|nr:hypothetical protein BDV96DRAFT_24991 [Lophiotrema nucula]